MDRKALATVDETVMGDTESPAKEKNAAPRAGGSARTARAWAVIACALFAVVGAAYCAYVVQRDRGVAELQALYAHALAHKARQIELKYDNYRQIVTSWTGVGRLSEAYARNVTAQRGQIAQQRDGQSDDFPGLLSSYADDLDACRKPWPDSNDEVGLCLARRIAAANEGRERGLSIVRCPSQVSAGGSPVFASDSGPASVIFPPAATADAMAGACGRAEVGALGFTAEDPATGARDPRVFDQLLLMKTDGTTLYSASRVSNVRAISLPSVDPKKIVSSGFVPDLELGAGKYEAFFQPIDVSVAFPCPPGSACPPSSAQAEGLVLCGLVPKDRYLGSMNHVSPTEFLLGAAVLGMSVLLLPLAKLWLVGRRSRFRRFDVALLVTSALVATFLLAMLMLSHLAKNRLYHRLDKQLAAVSAKATTRLTKQIENGAEVLGHFTETTRHLRNALAAFADASGEPDRAALSGSCPGGISGGGGRGDAESSPPVCEVTRASIAQSDDGWKLATWANANGDQQIKYVPPPRAHAPNPVNVEHRAYFRRAMEKEIGCFVGDVSRCRSDDLRGTAEVVRSSATGSIVLILARPTFSETPHSPPDPKSKPNGVATVDRVLEPFEKPVLPIGFQMAVIDSDGKVMLHSNGEEQQGQSLFDDLDDPAPLRALMSARTDDWLDATYLGVDSRFHVRRLPGVGWTVITIARRDLVEAPTANMVVLTTAGFLTLNALLVFLGVLALTVWRLLGIPGWRQPTVTLRPSSLEPRRYLRAAWWMILGTASIGVFAIGSTPAVPMTGLVLLALFVAIAGIVMLRTTALDRLVGLRTPEAGIRGSATKRAPLDFAAGYTLCCFGIAGVLVVAPVTALFVGAFDHLADNLVRSEEAHFAAQVHDNVACFENDESDEGACSLVFQGEPPIRVHKEAAIERYFASCWSWPLACVEDALPPILTGGINVFARLYLSPHSSDPSPPPGRTWIRTMTDLNLIPFGSSKRMTCPLPRLSNLTEYDFRSLAVVVIAFALLLVPALLVSYLSIRRVLFLDLSARLTRPGPEPATWLGSNRKVLLLYPPMATEEMLSNLGYADVTAVGPSTELPEEPVFAVAESIPRGYRTDLFERLARKTGGVVLLARADLVSRAPCDARDDWASALKTFEVVRGSLAKPFVPPGEGGTALFASLWSESTEDEQRVLAQIAIDGHTSPDFANRSTLEALCGRGLLEAATLTFARADFATFVRESATAEHLDAWESADGDTAWQMMRIPLATGITALSVILSSSHLEFAATGVLVPTIAAVLPTAAKLLTGSTSSG